DAAHQCERADKIRLVQVIEEDAADAPRLAAVFQEEILVAPFLVARVIMAAERSERPPAGTMEVACVLLVHVVPRSTLPAAEPPYADRAQLNGDKNSGIEMYRGNVGMAGMQYDGHAERLERAACKIRAGR